MTPLALFLLGCATAFLGTVQSAFSALMRLSLRLMAERGGRSDLLGLYLDDPMQLFVPARVLIALCIVLVGMLGARLIDPRDVPSIVTLAVSLLGFVIVCEHLVPTLIARRDPERVLDVLLPAFHAMVKPLRPVTSAIVGMIGPRREREIGNGPGAAES